MNMAGNGEEAASYCTDADGSVVDFLFKTFATLVAEEVDHPFPIFALN